MLARVSLFCVVSFCGAISFSSSVIRVCQGSSCLGKCRGSFNPLDSFKKIKNDENIPIELEETYCMNQCKRGPCVRIISDEKVLIFDDKMNETEMKRKAFQGVSTEEKVENLFGVAKGVLDRSKPGVESGSVHKLNDIMPQL